jgi:hypothetical protein
MNPRERWHGELPNQTLGIDDYNVDGDTDIAFMDEHVLNMHVVFYSTMD